MSRIRQFKLPDLGEGLTEGEILKWFVSPGDEVTLNQPIVEVETAKAAVEVPSPYAGVVTRVHHGEGETIDVGTPIIEFDTDPGAGPDPSTLAEVGTPGPDEATEPGLAGGPVPGERTAVLVGYGARTGAATRRPRKATARAGGAAPAPVVVPARQDPPASVPSEVRVAPVTQLVPAGQAGNGTGPAGGDARVLAKPPVRKMARDLGVDLRSITGSGPGGTITRADVESAAAGPGPDGQGGEVSGNALGFGVAEPRWDASREQRIPIRGVRKHTAAAVSASAFTAPHVTEFLTVDVTETMRLRDRVAGMADFAGVKVTPLAFVARALLLAVRRNPMINSSWDEQAQQIVVKEYVNLGIAAATPRGLVVPNIKDAGRLDLRGLAVALAELTATARAGRTTPADMQGGSITITNVGVFGVDTGTPILTPGESAILAFGAVREQPWVHEGEITIRQITQLALSFDHRIVDGDLGSMFLRDLGAVLADPSLAAVWG